MRNVGSGILGTPVLVLFTTNGKIGPRTGFVSQVIYKQMKYILHTVPKHTSWTHRVIQ